MRWNSSTLGALVWSFAALAVAPAAHAATADFEGLPLGPLSTPVDIGGIQLAASGLVSIVDASGVTGMIGQALAGIDGGQQLTLSFPGAPLVSFDLSVQVPVSRSFLAVVTAVGAPPTDFTIGQQALSVPFSDAPAFATKRFVFDSSSIPVGQLQIGLSASPANGNGDVLWFIDNVSAVPEPATWLLWLGGVTLLVGAVSRRRA